MKKLGIMFLAVLLWSSCVKNKVTLDKVIYDLRLSRHQILADGSSKVTISVKVNKESSTDKRMIIFKTSGGTLTNGTNGMVSVKADFDKDTLIAKAVLTAPSSGSKIYISVMPDISDRENYTLYDSITISPSLPYTIKLNPTSFGIKANYMSEDTIRAVIKNDKEGNVSTGTKVVFEDFLQNNLPANGKFRNQSFSSDGSGTVSGIYAIGNLPVGSVIFLKATVLDGNDVKTNIYDTIQITIIP